MKNKEISKIFSQMADILEITGENRFRVNSYRNAARVLEDTPKDVEELIEKGKLKDLPGIGQSMQDKIKEYIKNEKIKDHQDLLKKIPNTLLELLKIPQLGPKGVKKLWDTLDIKGIADLEDAIESGKLEEVEGFGKKKAEKLQKGIEFIEKSKGRIRLDLAQSAANKVIDYLKENKDVKKIDFAGSLRRKKETIGDVDILVASDKGATVIENFTDADFISEKIASGPTKGVAMIKVEGVDIHVDVRVVPEESFGAAMQYFTGSQQHNVKLREIAVKKKLKLNEYGLFKKDKMIAGKTEDEIYSELWLKFVDPRLREDRGEIQAAREDKLPKLLEYKDIKGNLHVHTDASDGNLSLEEMAEKAAELGYDYIVICDHSKSSQIANGLDEKRLKKQIDQIKKFNKKKRKITVFSGSEVDVDFEGNLDFDDDLLKELDFVVASIHSGMDRDTEKNTNRILKAMDNPYVRCIGHPTGRMIGEREAMKVSVEKIIKHAAETETFLEVNANPHRLDLNDVHCKMAIEEGVKLAIGTDAHSFQGLGMMHFGVDTAVRGWVTKDDVVNTKTAKQFKKICEKSKK